MANIFQKLFTTLNTISAVTGRVYDEQVLQGTAYPCVAQQWTSNPPAASYVASARLSDFNAQITLHTLDKPGLIALRSAVLVAVEAMPEQVVRTMDMQSPYEFQTKTYTWILGYQFRDFEQ